MRGPKKNAAAEFEALPSHRKAQLVRQTVCRYRDGESMEDIAESMGASAPLLFELVTKQMPEEWVTVRKAIAHSRKDRAERALDSSDDPAVIRRSESSIRAMQWELERLDREQYGSKEKGNASPVNIIIPSLRGGGDVQVVRMVQQSELAALPAPEAPEPVEEAEIVQPKKQRIRLRKVKVRK